MMNIVHCRTWKIDCLGKLKKIINHSNITQKLNFNFVFFLFKMFSTNVSCAWEYLNLDNIDFDLTWTIVKDIILKNFAGDPIEGVPSPSVQNTIYLSQKDILAAIPQVI